MAGLGPLAGMMNSPYGQYGSLLLSLLMGQQQNQQYEEARGQSEEQGRGAMDLYHALGGGDVSGYRPTSFAGHQLRLPFDAMKELEKYGSEIAQRMQGDTNSDLTDARGYAALANKLTQNRENRLTGEFDKGAAELRDYAAGRTNAVMDLLRSGGQGVLDKLGARTSDVMQRMGERTGGVMDLLRTRTAETQGAYDRSYSAGLNDLTSRYQRGLKNLEGAGAQERRDIDEAYKANEGRILSDLNSRGLGNSTVRQSMLQGNLREKTADQGRLNERLRAERLATDANLSGDVASAKLTDAINRSGLVRGLRGDEASSYSGLLGDEATALSGLKGDEASASGTYTTNLANTYGGLTGNYADLLGNLFTNRMNQSTGLSGQTMDTRLAGQGAVNALGSQGRRDLTNWWSNYGAQRQNTGMGANQGYLSTLTGANVQYPDNTALQVASNLGQGIGSANAFNWYADFANRQARPETILTNSLMGGLGGTIGGLGMSPFAGIGAGVSGGMQNLTMGRPWGY